MKALISPNEVVTAYNGTTGTRVAQVEQDANVFPVATPLYWLDCADNVNPIDWWFNNGQLELIPVPPVVTVASITPTSGSTAGGTTVVITGTNFIDVSQVSIGANVITFVVDSDTQITAITNYGIAGAKDVVVTTQYGSAIGTGLYTYTS